MTTPSSPSEERDRSTNIKERADFSCALLDSHGSLVVNAPHIPVHLGALGLCVRSVIQVIPLRPGDMIVTNHPAHGGSHLPDVTVISPVFAGTDSPIAYVANRAHHAEIGGITPGSMPPNATRLSQEGVVIPPTYLFRDGASNSAAIEELLTNSSPYPTRNLADNLADLGAQAAANLHGVRSLESLIVTSGIETIAGGSGAGPGYSGCGPLHTHMTNTAITDPEILEHRYPVRLHEFSERQSSGGAGKFPGGNGAIRDFEFLAELTLSILTSHRTNAPYGLAGGSPGRAGRQFLTLPTGERRPLPPIAEINVVPGTRLRIETPGGGGWGTP